MNKRNRGGRGETVGKGRRKALEKDRGRFGKNDKTPQIRLGGYPHIIVQGTNLGGSRNPPGRGKKKNKKHSRGERTETNRRPRDTKNIKIGKLKKLGDGLERYGEKGGWKKGTVRLFTG